MMCHPDRSAAEWRDLLFAWVSTHATDCDSVANFRFNDTSLFVVIRLQARRDRTPEQMRPNLHRHVPRVIRVPDPDIAAVLDDALIRGRLHANRLEGAGPCLALFLGLHLHSYGHGAHGVRPREPDA